MKAIIRSGFLLILSRRDIKTFLLMLPHILPVSCGVAYFIAPDPAFFLSIHGVGSDVAGIGARRSSFLLYN